MTQARTTAFILDHTISSALLFQLEQVSRKQGNNERIGPVLDGLTWRDRKVPEKRVR